MAHDLVPAHAGGAQRRRDRGGLREGQRENERLLVGVAGFGFLREGATANRLPPCDFAGVGRLLRGLYQRAIERIGGKGGEAGLFNERAGFDEAARTRFALIVFDFALGELQPGLLLFEALQAFGEGGFGVGGFFG